MTDTRTESGGLGRRCLLWLGAAWLALGPVMPAAAVDESDLLPVDQAFVLSAEAEGAGAIAIRWRIAEGYYLYRHRIGAETDAGFAAADLRLPPGTPYQDEFFGKVETYRGRLEARLPGEARAERTRLKVRYQGCADVGICYPPQTRTLDVALPPTPPAAATARPLVAFARPATTPSAGLLGPRAGSALDAAPLPPEQAFGYEAIAGDGNTLLVRLSPARGYYLYRDKTALRLEADGIRLGRPEWPEGTPYRDEHFGQVRVYFHTVDVPVPLLRTTAQARTVRLTAEFQGCQDNGICYPPMTRTVTIQVPAGRVDAAATSAATAREGPARGPGSPAYDGSGTASEEADAPDAVAAARGPAAPARVDAPPLAGTAGRVEAGSDRAAAPVVDPTGATFPAAAADAPGRERPPGLPPAEPGAYGILTALIGALLGGLILNLMPCVLPVLSLKAMSLVGSGQHPDRARRHALWYTAGVLASFAVLGGMALGLREAGAALGWGFQLQQPLVVAMLGLVMLALGLSMSGIWHAGGAWTGAGHGLTRQSGRAGDFFTGVLAVVVATPCTAPFMGAALAWAFTAPAGLAMAVFLALGLGLALPFVLIGAVPRLARFLPRPGAWMETLKQALAFPLYLTAVWLAWVLGRQRGVDAVAWWLVAAVATAFVAWAWTHARHRRSRWAGLAAAAALFAVAWPLRTIHSLPRPAPPASTLAGDAAGRRDHVPYSEQRVADLRAAGRVVFVNVTADWCVTCKANEKTVLGQAAFRDALDAANAVYVVGDWTDVDPALTAFLQQYDAVGVPLYVVLPPDGRPGIVLSPVLTLDEVRRALQAARSPAS